MSALLLKETQQQRDWSPRLADVEGRIVGIDAPTEGKIGAF